MTNTMFVIIDLSNTKIRLIFHQIEYRQLTNDKKIRRQTYKIQPI